MVLCLVKDKQVGLPIEPEEEEVAEAREEEEEMEEEVAGAREEEEEEMEEVEDRGEEKTNHIPTASL